MQIFPNNRLVIKPGFLIYLALLLLLLPLHWLLAWFFAACVHEICHCLLLKKFRISVRGLIVDYSGAVIQTDAMEPWQEMISALCGPLGGLCLLLVRKWAPMIAVCALVQSVFNLLPIYPLDGGRAARALMEMLKIPRSYRNILSTVAKCVLMLLCLFYFYIYHSVSRTVISLALIMICIYGFSACKQTKQIVK